VFLVMLFVMRMHVENCCSAKLFKLDGSKENHKLARLSTAV
jgi:hypothetical protein